MKVRTRLTLLFTLVTAMLISFYGVAIYYSSKEARETSFYTELKSEAVAKANLFFQGDLSEKEMHQLYKNNTQTLSEVQVAVYDSGFNLVYHDDSKVDYVKENAEMLSKIFKSKQLFFFLDDFQVAGIVYSHKGKQYAITAAAYDQYGYNSINHLLTISIISFIIILVLIYLAGLFLSKKALSPAVKMVEQIKRINAGKLQLRLDESEEKGEFHELEKSFNQMLERLDHSFSTQKHFVSNISHELNTPLAAMTAELELALQKNYTQEEYQKIILNALTDVKNMSKLSGSLMDLAKASYDPAEISFSEIRIDEILMDSYAKIRKENPQYTIHLTIDPEIDEQKMIHRGNPYLLLVAFNNLIDNACKYASDDSCRIDVALVDDHLSIQFINNGISISEKDQQNIFKPFYRAENSFDKKGYGIGLYLTQKIIDLHHARIQVSSERNTTGFQIVF
ncbi:HAMP domain-containing sensor histidine kinase [Chryseobacterium sp.]|uniref:HAMP domain-containing sensor histidine kinase n=1 Tax=Chryseobacterium sp. TaxID=1871047 RepID=UPI000EC5399F|nr:HAMP domain-containing sensor histidine kinase [Chryseobacterium sp.]HCA07355.1 two-component sensor histidine kinase [Chryseobacterium sp.]